MKKIRICLLIMIMLFTINVKADSCSDTEMARLKELANNVEFKSSYEIIENSDEIQVAKYTIKVINMNDDLKILYRESSDSVLEEISVSELESLKFDGGYTLEFRIYSYTANVCTNKLLTTKKVELLKYNSYYAENKEKCDKYPEFKYCKEFMNVKHSEFDKIDEEFSKYLAQNGNFSVTVKENNYIIYIIGGVVLFSLIGVGTLIAIKRRKKKIEF